MRGQSEGCWRGRFQGGGFRFTRPREFILDVLAKAKGHLSAEDIFLLVHKTYPNIGLTTVYRNLELLVEMGAVTRLHFGNGKASYELLRGGKNEHHHHLVCRKCSKIIDYADFMDEEKEFLQKVEKGLSQKYKFEIQDHTIHFHGLCEKCQIG
ncbi:MAG: Fur family transcriptional regulator [Candidatus Omnitrophica bacterium]|nr:Fur family transcriptional regulator [Candidatus Omnitrophota bacterium]